MLITAMNTPFYELLPEVSYKDHKLDNQVNFKGDDEGGQFDNCPPVAVSSNEVKGKFNSPRFFNIRYHQTVRHHFLDSRLLKHLIVPIQHLELEKEGL